MIMKMIGMMMMIAVTLIKMKRRKGNLKVGINWIWDEILLRLGGFSFRGSFSNRIFMFCVRIYFEVVLKTMRKGSELELGYFQGTKIRLRLVIHTKTSVSREKNLRIYQSWVDWILETYGSRRKVNVWWTLSITANVNVLTFKLIQVSVIINLEEHTFSFQVVYA